MEKKNNKINIETVVERMKLDKSYLNYHNIIKKRLPYKFTYLDEWLLKQSKLLMYESDKMSCYNDEDGRMIDYRVYKRGTIIKVDFGVNLGSEMSQVHFAIVLNNYDNKKNNVLTVVPLTSKASKFNLDLGDLIISKLIDNVKTELLKIGFDEESSNDKQIDIGNRIKIKKLLTLLSYYKSNQKNTYACCSLVTTISKSRFFPPINEFDTIGRIKCSSEVMDMIDKEILDKFARKV